ncbi:MAG: hypothetical protein ACI8PT_002520 [Gammaproteobacteria bacterium]|jgi:hypothetical protein
MAELCQGLPVDRVVLERLAVLSQPERVEPCANFRLPLQQ